MSERRPSDQASTATNAPRVSLPDAMRLQLLFEQNPVPLGVLAVSTGRYLLCNAAAERLFGYDSGEMVGLAASTVLDASAHGLLDAALAGDSAEYEHVGTVPMRTREGDLRWCEAGFQRIEFEGQAALLVTAADATRRVAAEDALRQSELMFRRGFEHAKIPTLMLDAHGICRQANRACLELLRLSPPALVGRPFLDLFEYDGASTRARLTQHLEPAGHALPAEQLRIRRPDGSDAWVLASITHLDGEGPGARYLAEIVDQTDLHLAIRALRDSEERLAFALEATTDGVWDWDVPSGRLYVNARWAEMLGYAPEELAAHISTWEALTHPDDRATAYEALERHIEGASAGLELEIRMRHKTGAWHWVLDRARIVARAADGSPLRIVGTHTDIHTRKASEEARRRQAELLDTVLANIPIGISIANAAGRLEYVNDFLVRTLGWSAAELCRPETWVEVYPDPAVRARLAAVIAAPEIVWSDWPMRRRDGRDLTMSWSNLRLPDGRVVGIARDVTELRAAEANDARAQAQMLQAQKLESLGLLAGGIAHDFNNLLVGVLGNASLAAESLAPEHEAAPLVADIRVAATRAADLTRQLLAYAGKGRFVVEPVDVNYLVTEMSALLRSAVTRRATLRHELAASLPPVEADATQLRQVVMNLITNASDAIGDRDGTIVLRTDVRRPTEDDRRETTGGTVLGDGRYVILEVTDSGAGMDAATLRRIFDPFFTTKVSGHGLGLAAALGIVRSHLGAIGVRSRLGHGTSIRLYLPAVERSSRQSPGTSRDDLRALQAEGDVLVADDESAVRDVTARALARIGYRVTQCEDGAQAVARFRADPERWRVVILDLTMPTLGGEDALMAMRAVRPDVPALLCSGYAHEHLGPAVTAMNGIQFLQKPFTVSALLGALAELVARDDA